MRIKGLRKDIKQNELVKTLTKHLDSKGVTEIRDLAKRILSGGTFELEDDWGLEQDLKDLGVKVD
jgi:hypothetical protein